MSRYRKKPVVIDAVQYANNEYADNPFGVREHPAPDWYVEAVQACEISPEFRSEDYWYLKINTLEGVMTASPDDWIIRGVAGELYPCRNDIFTATYETVED